MHWVSIGCQCTSGFFIREKGLNTKGTLPFDWVTSVPSSVHTLLKMLLEGVEIEKIVREEFCVFDSRLNKAGFEHFVTAAEAPIYYNSKYKMVFLHDLEDDNTICERYVRRFTRLKEILTSGDEIMLVYTSPANIGKNPGSITIDKRAVNLLVYEDLTKIMKLMKEHGIKAKCVLYDTHDIEDPSLLDESIELRKIVAGDHWPAVKEQMRI